jgi:hypothetical protein
MKEIQLYIKWKNIYSTIRIPCSCNNVKIYTIYKEKQKKKTQKNRKKLQMRFWRSRWVFLAPKMAVTTIDVKPVDLVVSFSWSCNIPQSEFPIKSYGRLKLSWWNFNFYFFYLISSFSLCLSSLLLYVKIDEKGLVICETSFFEFWFLDRWIGMNERWDENISQSVGANAIGGE